MRLICLSLKKNIYTPLHWSVYFVGVLLLYLVEIKLHAAQ